MGERKKESLPKEKTCNSFEEWKAHYLPNTTENELAENLRSNTSNLAIELANRSVDELLSQKLLNN